MMDLRKLNWLYLSLFTFEKADEFLLFSGKPFDMNNLMNPTGKQFDSSGESGRVQVKEIPVWNETSFQQ